MVADDNRDSADSLALLLEFDGHDVAVTYSGHQALERGREGHPDVVILDIGMPDMTGYEAARRIRLESSRGRCMFGRWCDHFERLRLVLLLADALLATHVRNNFSKNIGRIVP